MWSQSYSQKVTDLNPEEIWSVWIDINQWSTWQDDIDFAKTPGPMKKGSMIEFRPKGGPTLNLEITEYESMKLYTDLTKFPFAKMRDSHELIVRGNEVEIKTTINIEGPLSFIWRKIVAEKIVKDLPKQTQSLVDRVKTVHAR